MAVNYKDRVEGHSNDYSNDLKKALDYLNIDESDLKEKSVISVKSNPNVSDKVLEVNKIAFSFKMILEGKEFDEDNTEYRQKNKAIAGSHFIRLVYGILNNFGEKANLVGQKSIEDFNIQFSDAFEKVNNVILLDRTIKERDSRLIIKLFKDAMKNIGDIICNNKDNMQSVFGNINEGTEEKARFDD